MITMIGVIYVVASMVSLAGWHAWRRKMISAMAQPHLRYLLHVVYGFLVFTLVAFVLVCIALRKTDLSEGIPLSIVFWVSSILVIQAALLGFVLTPLAFARLGPPSGFWRALLKTECCLVLPVAAAAAINVWLFVRTGHFIAGLVG